MTTFSDIFKSSFLENVTSVSLVDMFVTMALAFGMGVFIFFVYKKTLTRACCIPAGFGADAGGACPMITTLVIMAVTSNVVLSLGMVGALSIVRFRTAIKEPVEIVFLFWSHRGGHCASAAGMIPLAVFGSVVIGVVLLFFVNRKAVSNPFIAVVSCADAEAEKRAVQFLGEHVEKASVKSKTAQSGNIEFTCEVRLKGDDTAFITALSEMEGVNSAVLVSYNGDYMG